MKLKHLRETRGISQLKLAMDLSMNQNSISRYENGVREADYATLIKFADYFNVSLDYLLERTDNQDMLKSKPPVEPVVCSAPIRGRYWLYP